MPKNEDVIKLSLDELRDQTILAKDVLNTWGSVLLPKGELLSLNNYPRLTINNVRFVHVAANSIDPQKPLLKNASLMPELRIEKLKSKPEFQAFNTEYTKMNQKIKATLVSIGNGSQIKLEDLFDLTDGIMSKLKFKNDLFVYLNGLHTTDEHTFNHCNNVSLLCNLFASWLGLNDEDTLNLTTAGLLHDIGKTKIDNAILNKKEKLTPEEFKLIRQHSTLGYNILKKHDIPDSIKLAALQHHEKIDGTGYPLRLRNDKIEPLAKMVSICDIYDAMTANRAYRDKLSPFCVIRQFEQRSYGELDTEYLLVFLKNIAYTYCNCYVKLSDGRDGQIVFINPSDLSNPMVRVSGDVIDLRERDELSIVSVL